MGTVDDVAEIDTLERGLLSEPHGGGGGGEEETDDDRVLYTASFQETEEKFVKYQTAQWVMYSLILIFAWGIGLFMFLYLPVRRYILRKDIQSRKLFLTPNSIVYKVTKPVVFPCFGVLQKEKHVLLASVSDIIIEQGYLQSLFDVYSVRIENVGVKRPPSDDVRIQGIANPGAFKKAVLTQLSHVRSEILSRQISARDDFPSLRLGHSSSSLMSPIRSQRHLSPVRSQGLMSPVRSQRHDLVPGSGEAMLLLKLEEVGNSVKRVQSLIEEKQHSQTSEFIG